MAEVTLYAKNVTGVDGCFSCTETSRGHQADTQGLKGHPHHQALGAPVCPSLRERQPCSAPLARIKWMSGEVSTGNRLCKF